MADKELWKTAYDAHWSWYDEVSERPKRWETDADECDAAAFQASAEAVAKRVEGPVYPKEREVIEAARAARADLRAFLDRHYELFGTTFPHPFARLVDALQALEREK